MVPVHLSVFARSDVGRVRDNNEDSFAVSDIESGKRLDPPAKVDVRDRGVLIVVSDGMGGNAAGEVASSLVVDSLRKSLSDTAADHSSLQRLIDSAVKRANQDAWKAASDARKRGMGATLTAVLVHDAEAYIAEVGDSRAYLLRSGRLRQITTDQSFVQILLDAGALTPEQARDSPQKNIILQAMGLAPTVQVSIGRLHLRQGDRLLVCSDGVFNKVSNEELLALLASPTLDRVCSRMIELANERGGEDNLTAVATGVEGDGLPLPDPQESVGKTLDVLQEFNAYGNDGPKRGEPERPPAPQQPTPEAVIPAPAPAATGTLLKWPVLIGLAFGVVVATAAWWFSR